MPRPTIPNQVIPTLLLADGIVSILFAISAHILGMDPNPNWGRSRVLIFILGVLLLGFSFFLYTRKPAFTSDETPKTVFLIGHVWVVIFIIYTWFITFGTFTEWRASTRYYSLLADAFGKGHIYVDVEPGAALLAADDPYNSEGRPAFDDDVWDLSLYKGKLYLYWGPVPALLLTPVQLVFNTHFADMYLVFFFFCGLLVFNSLIILKLWRLFFSDLLVGHVVLSIFIIGLILPILWSLSIPDVYEAAIGAGQFFLIGGIYFVILTFEKNIQRSYLFWTGFFWACSVGSRAINVLPILLLVALTLYWLWKTQSKNWILNSAHLLTPLAMGAFLIGWYNYARFDSPLEFGQRYQITIYNLNRNMPLVFQADYVPYNILAYVLLPFRFISNFPFIEPIGLSAMLRDLGVTTSKLYAAGNVTGIFFFAPFLLLALTPFLKKNLHEENQPSNSQLRTLTFYLLGGSFLVSFISLLLYYYGQMRFMVDVISQVTLLAVVGYWMIILKPRRSKAYLYFANVLILFTLIVSLLLATTSESGRMQKLNPALMDKLNSLLIKQE